jgi:hypothetical protein
MDTTQQFQKGSEPVTFTLPAGTKFPTDLSIIMKKTGRFFSLEYGIEAVSLPTCEGDGCECVSCQTSGCMNANCINFTTSIDNIQCNNSSCARSNDVKYYMTPLYPDTSTYLSEYNPKFRFIKFIPPQKIQQSFLDEIQNRYLKKQETEYDDKKFKVTPPPGWTLEPGMTFPPGDFIPLIGTIPPGETIPPGWKIVSNMLIPPGNTFPPEFGVAGGPDSRQVNTQSEMSTELKFQLPANWALEPGMTFPPGDFVPLMGTMPPGETPLPGWKIVSNMLIPPGNTFPPESGNASGPDSRPVNTSGEIESPELVVFSITYPDMTDFNTSEKFNELCDSVLTYILGFLILNETKYVQHNIAVLQQIIKINNLPKTLFDPKKISITQPSTTTDTQIIEKYDDIDLQNLVVPASSYEDTDVSTELMTPEPDETEKTTTFKPTILATTTMAPKPKGLSIGAKVGIGIAVVFFVIVVIGGVFYTKSKKQGKKKGK